MMAWPGRYLGEAQCPQLAAHARDFERDAEFLEYPLCKILPAPAHHAVNRRDRPAFDDPCKGLALPLIELAWLARRLAVNETIRPFGIEPQNPVSDNLKTDITNSGRIRTTASIINLCQCKKTAALAGVLRRLRKSTQIRPVKISPQCNRSAHDEPPKMFAALIQTFSALGTPQTSLT